ncbi:Melibiose/raffinose/stachyose import permease protein MelD [Paenibacillus allorhizoplanae]|uniref:Melibiose/raffinose/stachyose import permease protein MelD n=1 Tax=Paenibacillus allorhizoplanae TaxID=2905648 RepID=A0ABM9CPS1_9BACL|nr:sugar ABC transporter permease [Paenibacillus allorhizoplanae]CAH1220701.1 Melibiose/raffinose/stachyose import permease protein MelD [Paenibacillus allorhizoplanae]
MSYQQQKITLILSFLIVPLTLLLTFTYYPALRLIYLSFTSWDGLTPVKTWVGFSNYKEIMGNREVFYVFLHNVAYFVGGILQNVVAFFFAVLLNSKLKGRNVFRTVLFLPYIMNGVAVAFMFGYVFDTNTGSLNYFLSLLGMDPISWLGKPGLVNVSLASIGVWKFMGFNMVVYLGALQSLPEDLYEAAKIDGARRFQVLRYITIPGMRKIIELNLFLTVIGALEVFDLPFVLTKGGPLAASKTYVQQTVETAFQYNNFGLASAMSVLLMIVVIVVVSAQRRIVGGKEE